MTIPVGPIPASGATPPQPPVGPPPINGPATVTVPAVRVNPPTGPANPNPSLPPVPPGPVVRSVQTSRNLIALTFDDGPSGGYTDAVLATLRRHDARATFYVVGANANADPGRLRQMAADGHDVANHSWNHPMLTGLSDAQIAAQLTQTSDAIERATGRRPDTFRPPGGARSPRVDAIAASLGMRDVMWSIDTLDWKLPGAQAIVNTVVNNARPGAIVLMHDGGGRRQQTVDALEPILVQLKERGYEFVTVPELIAAQGT